MQKVCQILGRMTGIQFPTGLERTEHSPLIKPLCSARMQLVAGEQEQEQFRITFEDTPLKQKIGFCGNEIYTSPRR